MPGETTAELRKQLKELRKGSSKPVSKMSKMDCALEIERMKHHSASTPAVNQQSPSEKHLQTSTAPTLKKHQEHPLPVPASEKMAAVRAAKGKKAAPAKEAAPESKMSKKELVAMMKKMMEESDGE